MTSMSPLMCVNSAGTQAGVNDQRGVLAVTASTVLYTGDAYTVYLPNDTVNVATPVAMNRVHDAMVSDLRTGVGYFFANGANVEPMSNMAGNVTQLITLNDQGVEIVPRRAIQLSVPIPMSAGGVGFYSGYNRIIVWTGAAWYNVAMPSGVVTQLMGPAPVTPFPCESWAHSGIAEYFGGEPYVVFMSIAPNTGVVRQRIATGAITVVTMTSPGDVCSVSISPLRNRWYSQYEVPPSYIAAGGDEHVVMCPATWDSP